MNLPLCYAQDTERKKRDGDGFAFMLCPRYSKSLSPTASTTNRLRENVTFLYHRYPIFSARLSVTCKSYTRYQGASEIERGLCACTVDNPLAKARDYLSVQAHKPCSIPNTLIIG